MLSNKKYKVLAICPKSDGSGDFFQKVGMAFENKDSSLNCYVETLPLAALSGGKGLKLQIREWDEVDEQRRRENRMGTGAPAAGAVSEAAPY